MQHPAESTKETTNSIDADNIFNKLHYPPKKQPLSLNRKNRKFNSESQSIFCHPINPQLDLSSHFRSRPKGSIRQKIRQYQSLMSKQQSLLSERHSSLNLSIKVALGPATTTQVIHQYCQNHCIQNYSELNSYGSKNLQVRMALQKAKQEKIKISKILKSHKQPQETKAEYLLLKKKDLDQQISNELKDIYDQFFKKQYEGFLGAKGFEVFAGKFKEAISILQKNIGSK